MGVESSHDIVTYPPGESFNGLGPALAPAPPLGLESFFLYQSLSYEFSSDSVSLQHFKAFDPRRKEFKWGFVLFRYTIPSLALYLKGGFLSTLTSFLCEHLARSVWSGPASGYKFPLCLQPPEVLYFLASPHSACSNSLNILAELLFCVSSSIYPRLASSYFSFILGVHFLRFRICFLPCNLS